MAITVDLPPEVEQAYRAEAKARGLSLDAIIRETLITAHPKSVFEQGLGLFGNPEDAALPDEVAASLMRRGGSPRSRLLRLDPW